MRPTRTVEDFLEALVSHLCIGNSNFAFEGFRFRRANLIEEFVYIGIHAADKERGDRSNMLNAISLGETLFQTREICLCHMLILTEREHQRDIDIDALFDELPDRSIAFF